MERPHKSWIESRFEGLDLPRIEVLGIPDDFDFMDSELQDMLKATLDPEIESILSPDPN